MEIEADLEVREEMMAMIDQLIVNSVVQEEENSVDLEVVNSVVQEEEFDEPIKHFKKMLKTLIIMRTKWRIHQAALVMTAKIGGEFLGSRGEFRDRVEDTNSSKDD